MRTVARITRWSMMFLQMIFEGFLGEQTMHKILVNLLPTTLVYIPYSTK